MPAIPRKTPTAVDRSELLADLFAVVEEFDSVPGDGVVGPNGHGGAALATTTIDRAAVKRAFDFACDRHADQRRYSGDEFITHPVGVAQICAGMRLDTETLCAALLHDTVEDTSASLEEIRTEFGEEIALLVDGVTKLTGMTFESRDERQAENYRKMMVAMATDIRVILIKLADRLHNMRTLGALPKQKQTLKSRETLEIYAPLAHRLGIHAIKWELEDIAFQTLHPRKYTEIKQLVAQQRDERETYVSEAGEFLAEELAEVGIEAEISGRDKHFYSIYTKMTKKGREFNEIFDLTAMRVIVGSVKDCYGAIGVIHSLWKPLPGRFKDFVAMPKANMYQALHTTVIGPEGKPLEIQIRTDEMHKLAEYGIAAHVAYKEGGASDPQREKMTWLRQLVEAEGEQDPSEFLESLKVDLFEDEVFVFTPKGEVKSLSAGSTPLDFAYSVHTDVGHRCVGAKVNGAIVPLHYQLKSGDIVEVLTAKQKRGPSLDWLKLVRTSRARNKIRAWFKEERREDAERKGREALDEALRTRGLPMQKVVLSPLFADAIREVGFRKATDFYIAVGQGKVSTKTVANKLMQRLKAGEAVEESPPALVDGRADRARRTKDASNYGIRVKGVDNVAVRLAKCCRPVPGDEIAGYVSLGRGITIHRTDCNNVKALKRDPERFVEVGWDGENESSYRVELQIDAYDRTRLLEDLARTFSEAGINIIGATCTTNHPMVKNSFVVEVGDTEQLKQCISRLRNVESVFDAYRITPKGG
ncbi:MAG TPA: bifunctional (p)ppGpp synthetase/guanosine-3',5'-bis(diphosphate) 3'-pyrophosphohydrolase [Solirubrobacterales bacterium]|nr:bifunctional (p)ppGpp synthetase/guanosine-3',5'-bis(diphosphate) 3'-pyrophosphohydrolase [Solirubrobacterales bacterium]